MKNMFLYCTNLKEINLLSLNTSNVTDMSGMFHNCYTLNFLDLSRFYTKNVTDMSYMFTDCHCLIFLDLSYFDTSNVTNMNYMFYNCNSLSSLDLSNFKYINVINKIEMFPSFLNSNNYEISTKKYEHFNLSFKNMNIGDSSSRKTGLIEEVLYGEYKNNPPPALFDFYFIYVKYKDKIIRLNIWDSCEQEVYLNNIYSHTIDTSMFLFVYSINNLESFRTLAARINKSKNYLTEKSKLFLIGNKIGISENE